MTATNRISFAPRGATGRDSAATAFINRTRAKTNGRLLSPFGPDQFASPAPQALGGAVTGAAFGAMLGGPLGAAFGAVAGSAVPIVASFIYEAQTGTL